jgi:tetratricopeptide (TPR) repeat protein
MVVTRIGWAAVIVAMIGAGRPAIADEIKVEAVQFYREANALREAAEKNAEVGSYNAQDWTAAVEKYQRAIESAGNVPDGLHVYLTEKRVYFYPHRELGWAYYNLGHYKEALEQLADRYVMGGSKQKSQFDTARRWLLQGLCYIKQGDKESAQKALQGGEAILESVKNQAKERKSRGIEDYEDSLEVRKKLAYEIEHFVGGAEARIINVSPRVVKLGKDTMRLAAPDEEVPQEALEKGTLWAMQVHAEIETRLSLGELGVYVGYDAGASRGREEVELKRDPDRANIYTMEHSSLPPPGATHFFVEVVTPGGQPVRSDLQPIPEGASRREPRLEYDPNDPALSKPPGERYALLIGVSYYQDQGLNPLPACAKDVQDLQKVLTDPALGDYCVPEANIRVLTTDAPEEQNKPTLANVTRELQWLEKKLLNNAEANQGMSRDFVFFFFSGHGDTLEGKSYLLLEDTVPTREKLSVTALSTGTVNTLFEGHRGRQGKALCVVDACHAGGTIAVKAGRSLFNPEEFNRAWAQARGVYFLQSCTQEQSSWVRRDMQNSVFSYFLAEGLRGTADRQTEGGDANGYVDFFELYNYLSRHVSQYAREELGRDQTPVISSVSITRLPLLPVVK